PVSESLQVKEPARGGQRACLGHYGDLAASARAAVIASRSGRFWWWLSESAFELDAALMAAGNGHDRDAECVVRVQLGSRCTSGSPGGNQMLFCFRVEGAPGSPARPQALL